MSRTLDIISGDTRGAEGANKILILALVAIPLVIVLIFFGGEVVDYLKNAWEDRHGKQIREGGSLFDPDLPGEEPGAGDGDGDDEEPEEECTDPELTEDERKRCQTIHILIDDIYLYVEWALKGGEPGTGMTLGEYRKEHWTGELIEQPADGDKNYWAWPADAWGGRCILNPYDAISPHYVKELRARSEYHPGRDIHVLVQRGPDDVFATEDDLVWEDCLYEPPPEGWRH